MVGIKGGDLQVRVNFGDTPFVYQDLDEQNSLLAKDEYHTAARATLETEFEESLESSSDDGAADEDDANDSEGHLSH